MAAELELVTRETPATTVKTLNAQQVLSAGGKLKMELGDGQELDVVVPEGETWSVHVLYTIKVI